MKRIQLDFAFRIEDGHAGPRKFWRQYLPRLKYHNPSVSMTVNRTTDQTAPAILTVFFATPGSAASSSSSASSASGEQNEITDRIDMKHKRDNEILDQFMHITKAIPYEATPEEVTQMAEVKEMETRSRKARAINDKFIADRAREAAILEMARKGIASTS